MLNRPVGPDSDTEDRISSGIAYPRWRQGAVDSAPSGVCLNADETNLGRRIRLAPLCGENDRRVPGTRGNPGHDTDEQADPLCLGDDEPPDQRDDNGDTTAPACPYGDELRDLPYWASSSSTMTCTLRITEAGLDAS